MLHRPTYHHGALIPLATARWFFQNPVDKVSLVPVAERTERGMMRFHSGDRSIVHHCSWGIEFTQSGRDKQGRNSLIDLIYHEEMVAIVAWEDQQAVDQAA